MDDKINLITSKNPSKKNKISVVITTRNRLNLFKKSLESALNQTLKPNEIIIIDDASDNYSTLNYVHSLNNPILHFFRNNSQLGGNKSRNLGITKSTSSLIAFLDDDDYWHHTKLQKQYEKFSDLNVIAVYTGYQYVSVSGATINANIRNKYPKGDLSKALLLEDNTGPTSTYMVRKQSLETVGLFDSELSCRQDWDLWIRLSMHGLIESIPEILVSLTLHSSARTSDDYEKIYKTNLYIYKKYKRYIDKLNRIYIFKYKSIIYLEKAVYLNKSKSLVESPLKYYILSFIFWPFRLHSIKQISKYILNKISLK